MPLFVTIHLLIWSNFIFYLIDTIFSIIMCSPREKIWNLLMTDGHCFDGNALFMASGIFNVLSDFAILLLPAIPIWRLQMPLKRKMMIGLVFWTGLLYVAFHPPSFTATSIPNQMLTIP